MKLLLIVAGSALLLFTLWFYLKNPLSTKVVIRNQTIYVDVAATPTARERGLSGRTSLPENHGMLFVFGDLGKHGFWMRGMNFSLDFIWVRDKTVFELTPNVPPPTEGEVPVVLEPYYPIDMVLEVNAGTIDRLGIKEGDKITIDQ